MDLWSIVVPKPDVDWSALEEAMHGLPPPEAHFALQIEQQVGRIEFVIREATDRRIKMGSRLVSFADNSNPEDNFARHAAMLEVFGRHGVLDAYYGLAENYDEKEIAGGWEVTLAK